MSKDRNDLAAELLGKQLEDGELLVNWILVAKIMSPGDVTSIGITSDDMMDHVTSLGLATHLYHRGVQGDLMIDPNEEDDE